MAKRILETKKAVEIKKEVELKYDAPQAGTVSLAGTFNKWEKGSLLAKKGRNGTWSVKVALLPGKYEYKFVVDGSWLTDPSCKQSVPNSLGSANSVLVVK